MTGANGGLGQALCKILAEQAVAVLPIARLDADLSNRQERQQVIHLIEKHAPDLVINNAGFTLYGDCLSHPLQAQMDIFEVNAAALLEISLAAALALRRNQRPGVIVNVSSIAGEFSFPGMAVYAASKAFVTSFSQSFDAELQPYQIRVLASLPGQIKTAFADKAAKKQIHKRRTAMDPEAVAREIWRQIQRRERVRIIDWRYRWMYRLARLFPKRLFEGPLYREILRRM